MAAVDQNHSEDFGWANMPAIRGRFGGCLLTVKELQLQHPCFTKFSTAQSQISPCRSSLVVQQMSQVTSSEDSVGLPYHIL